MLSLGQWLLMAYLSRSEGAGVLGAYTLAVSIISPFLAIVYSGARSIIAADVGFQYRLSDILMLRMIILLLVGAVIFLSFVTVSPDSILTVMVMLVFAVKIPDALADICYGGMYRAGRSYFHGISIVIKVIMAATVFYFSVDYYGSYRIGMVSIAIVWLVVMMILDVKFSGVAGGEIIRSFGRFLRHGAKGFFLLGAPLGVSAALGAVLFNVPNYAIASFHGVSMLGVYSAMFSFVVVLNMIGATAGQIALPLVAGFISRGDAGSILRVLAAGCSFLLVLGAFFSVFVWFFGGQVLYLMFGEHVSQHSEYFVFVAVLAMPLLIAQFLSYVVTAYGRYRIIMYATISGLLISVVFSFWLVVDYGIIGASLVVFMVGIVQVSFFSSSIFRSYQSRVSL
jgi:O-antigen/teichoic acid export membrane protein